MIYGQLEEEKLARETMKILETTWFRDAEPATAVKNLALELAKNHPGTDWLVFHWGLCLANFPLFWNTAMTIGRRLRTQDTIKEGQVLREVGEKYRNQGAIYAAVEAILRSLLDWGVLGHTGDDEIRAGEKYGVDSPAVLEWLLMTSMISGQVQSINLANLVQLPALFPFEFEEEAGDVVRMSDFFRIWGDRTSQEMVRLNPGWHGGQG